MICSNCGAENPTEQKFCNECAAPFKRRCAKCGYENAPAAKFCGECAAALTPDVSKSPTRTPSTPSVRVAPEQSVADAAEGERKTVTALFADIKGSMELMEDIDPEEARAIVDPALKLMIDAVHRYDGYIVQSTGDGIFALFGAPAAYEDHPQRALYTALRMQEDLKRYSDRIRAEGRLPIQVRVGVNTGEVVVRSIKTDEAHTEYTPIGHSISLAARMQALAPIGSIAATENSHHLCEGYFTFKPLGPTKVKGVSEPVNVYEVTGLGPLRTRLQRSAGRGLTKFVGRQREMEAMKHAAAQAKAGHGQIVAAIAEAGVGKSRLFFEFKAIAQSGFLVVEAFSVSYGKATAYLPVIELLHNYFGIAPEDERRKRREKVAGKLTILDRSFEDVLPYLFALLGIAEGHDPLEQMDAQVRRRRMQDAIKRTLLRESLNQPLMLVFEDLHWIDDETQALLNALADGIANAPVLMLVNYRPEYSHTWGSKTYYTQLRLDPLGKESADEMLNALVGDGAELIPLKRLVLERTEGNPFFMEEMVQALFDEGLLVRNGVVKLTKPLGQLKIPPTVQGILAARIDRLPPAEKDLLQTLAVIGKEFPLSLVQAVVHETPAAPSAADAEERLDRMLQHLQFAEFIHEQPAIGDVEYAFKHALTQEVAYGSMLTGRRDTLHGRAAAAIEKIHAARLDDHLAELAHHYGRSGDPAKATDYLWRAGGQATQRSSYAEAERCFTSALDFLHKLPQSDERRRTELAISISLGVTQMASKGFSSDEVESTYSHAYELAGQLGDRYLEFAALQGLWAFNYTRGNVPQSLKLAEESIALAGQFSDGSLFKDAYRAMGLALAYVGELVRSRDYLERAIATAQSRIEIPSARLGPDANVTCLSRLADVLWELGYPDQALSRGFEAMAISERKHDSFSYALGLVAVAQTYCQRREPAKGEEFARRLVALSTEQGFPYWLTIGRRIVGWALVLQGRHSEGIAMVEEELRGLSGQNAAMARYNILPTIAQAYRDMGDPVRGLALADEWIAISSKLGLVGDAMFYRLRGSLLLKLGRTEEAEDSFRRAIDAAVRHSAKIRELQATTSLARLLRDTGRRDEARPTLAGIYGWFTEGFDTADLKDAKALLDELNG